MISKEHLKRILKKVYENMELKFMENLTNDV